MRTACFKQLLRSSFCVLQRTKKSGHSSTRNRFCFERLEPRFPASATRSVLKEGHEKDLSFRRTRGRWTKGTHGRVHQGAHTCPSNVWLHENVRSYVGPKNELSNRKQNEGRCAVVQFQCLFVKRFGNTSCFLLLAVQHR